MGKPSKTFFENTEVLIKSKLDIEIISIFKIPKISCYFAIKSQTLSQAQLHGRAFWGCVPLKLLLVPPKREMCPIKRGLCPKEITASVPLECISGPEPPPQILIFTPEFAAKSRFLLISRQRHFFGLCHKICGFLRICRNEDLFLVLTQEFVNFCSDFAMKTFFLSSPQIS